MNVIKILRSSTLLGIAVALAACGGGSSGGGSDPSNRDLPLCAPPGNLQMVYPPTGSNLDPPSDRFVYFASSANIGNDQYISASQIVPGAVGLSENAPFTPVALSEVPKPRANAGFSNPQYFKTNIGGPSDLQPSSQYTIYFVWNSSTKCFPFTGTPPWTFRTNG
jgi:hypothetical protein